MPRTWCHPEHRTRRALRAAVVLALALAPSAAAAARLPALVPPPQSLRLAPGEVPMRQPWSVVSDRPGEDAAAIEGLVAELEAAYGWRPASDDTSATRVIALVQRAWPAGSRELARRQGYELTIAPSRITIAGETAAGRYYGIQTLRQLVRAGAGAALPRLVIRDAPRLALRGVSEDISRGQMPTLASLCATVRELGYYKMNLYQLYIEDVYDFAALRRSPSLREPLTAEELAFLSREAARHHVTLVPILQTLGHQERLLARPEFQHLAEIRAPAFARWWSGVRGWFPASARKPDAAAAALSVEPEPEPAPASLCPTDPRARAFMRGLIAELCRVDRGSYLHCGGDEPFDVGRGRSRAAIRRDGYGMVYAGYYADLELAVADGGRRMMLYGDVLLARGSALRRVPKSIVVVDWHYDPLSRFGSLDTLRRAGFTDVIASAGSWNWRAFHPDQGKAFANIRAAAAGAQRFGGLGAMVASWGDGGAECLNASNWAGYAYLAACAWAREAPDETAFLEAYARTTFGEPGARIAEVERRLGWVDLGGRPWHGRVFARPPTIHPRTEPWRATMAATRASMVEALAILDATEPQIAHQTARLAVARHAAERYRLLADRELLLDEVARALRAESGRPLPEARRIELATRLRECAGRTARLAENYRTLWLAHNRPEGSEFLVDRLRQQARTLAKLERAAREGTLEEWRPHGAAPGL